MDSMVMTEVEGAVEKDGQSRDVKNVIVHNLQVLRTSGHSPRLLSAQNQSRSTGLLFDESGKGKVV